MNKKFIVTGTCTIPVYIEVEARNEAEAKQKAQDAEKYDWEQHGESCDYFPDDFNEITVEEI
jgi:hypothetical protein